MNNFFNYLLEKYLFGSHKSKLLLALESNLPNELDWAYNKLIKLSFNCPINFHIGVVPGLIDAFIDHLQPFFSKLILSTRLNDFETKIIDDLTTPSPISLLITPEFEICLERTLQILHIIRNFSSLEINARFFSTFSSVVTMLAKGML